MILLNVSGLEVSFPTRHGAVKAVTGMDLTISAGELVGLVGESGCGKSVTALAVLNLLPKSVMRKGTVHFKIQELTQLSERAMQKVRGSSIAMVFQDPFESLNPVMRVGDQIAEALRTHAATSRDDTHKRVFELLKEVQIPDPQRLARSYPHEASGGMRQRAMLAMALACNPELLIADEPTTALDVTTQAEILKLLREIKQNRKMGILFITHDLALVSQVADRVVVMYAGRVVEEGAAQAFFKDPKHPYSRALIKCVPRLDAVGAELAVIDGEVPNPLARPTGCAFHPRCTLATERCSKEEPPMEPKGNQSQRAACWEV